MLIIQWWQFYLNQILGIKILHYTKLECCTKSLQHDIIIWLWFHTVRFSMVLEISTKRFPMTHIGDPTQRELITEMPLLVAREGRVFLFKGEQAHLWSKGYKCDLWYWHGLGIETAHLWRRSWRCVCVWERGVQFGKLSFCPLVRRMLHLLLWLRHLYFAHSSTFDHVV